MADFYDTAQSTDLVTALGGTTPTNPTSNGDSVHLRDWTNHYASVTDLSSTDLALIEILAGARGSFRSAYLTAVINAAGAGIFRDHSNMEEVKVKSSSTAGVIASLDLAPQNNHPITLGDMDCATAWLSRGSATQESGCDVATWNVTGAARLTILAGSAQVVTLNASGDAHVSIARDAGTVNIKENSTVRAKGSTFAPTTIVLDGGTFAPEKCGTCTTITANCGEIDLTKNQYAFVVTNAVSVGPSVTIRRKKKGNVEPTWTLTNVFGGPINVYED